MGIFVFAALVALAALRGARLATPALTAQLEVFQAASGLLRTISNFVDAFQRLVAWFAKGQIGPAPLRGAGQQQTSGATSSYAAPKQSPFVKPGPPVDMDDEPLEPAAVMGGKSAMLIN